jgi:DNA invertase Pin-like site-specific DNA recombinase
MSLIGERTRAALAVKRDRGERLGGEPLGLRASPLTGALEPLEVELAPVRLVLAKRAAGGSFARLQWNYRPLACRRSGAAVWRSETVRKVWLRRTLYERLLA